MFSPKMVAFIPARGGSKRLPGKNVKELCGKPLIAYSIEVALECPEINACYVSTEDPSIASVAQEYGAEVIERPQELALDDTSSVDVVVHALKSLLEKGISPEAFVLLQPTSPLRTLYSLRECLKEWNCSTAASAVTLTQAEHHPYKTFLSEEGVCQPLLDYKTLSRPAQELPVAYRTNGAVYVVKSNLFLQTRSFFPLPLLHYIMPAEESVDIDTECDFLLAELLMKKRERENHENNPYSSSRKF
jgi:CMP-N-acetylneuraminic acid synthetase